MTEALAPSDAPAIPLYLVEPADMRAVREGLDPVARRWVEASGFSGALGEVVLAPDAAGAPALALAGWGTQAARMRGRFHVAAVADALPSGVYRIETALDPEDAEEAALGWALGAYRFSRRFKADEAARPDRARLAVPDGVSLARMRAMAEATALARDLVNAPANELGPVALDAAARALAERCGAEAKVVAGDALLEANFPLIHAVGRAGEQPPRLIDLRWGVRGRPRIVVVGKGVCFDTGGLDIKPSSAMRLMKKDMGGAAAALGLAAMIMTLKLPVRLHVLIPAVENVVGPASFRPGDVLKSRKGPTVEVSNTDAEGRLVLADALTAAAERDPALVVDFATLTGAARVALGPDLPAFFTDDETLAAQVAEGARKTRDPVWRLPLHQPYESDVESAVADLDNAPAGGMAGAITAALFLRRFAPISAPWAHFDIYGWTPKAKPGRPVGGELQAARAVFAALEARYA